MFLRIVYGLAVHFPSFTSTYTQERWSHGGMLFCDWLFGFALLAFLVLCVLALVSVHVSCTMRTILCADVIVQSPVLEFAYTEALDQLRLEALFARGDPVAGDVGVVNPLQAAGQVGAQGEVPLAPQPVAVPDENGVDVPILQRQDAVEVESDSDSDNEENDAVNDEMGMQQPPRAPLHNEEPVGHGVVDNEGEGDGDWGGDVAPPQANVAQVEPPPPAFPLPDPAFDDPPPITLSTLVCPWLGSISFHVAHAV
jgi:hypothetical protein